jgi:ABC-2 type transport system ATP-binding protein
MDRALLQAIDLSLAYGEFQAVTPTWLNIHAGEIVVVSGPNGAGKTTLLHCLSGLLRPTRGSILVEGFDLYKEEVAAKQRLAFIPDVPRFYQELTSLEHLKFICLAYGVEHDWETRAENILHEFNLWECRDLYPHNLSRGMRLKLGITLALVRPFSVLLMDEPTSALDQESSTVLSQKLLTKQKNGCAILLTSHDVKLMEAVNGTLWYMNHGKLSIE